MAQTRGKVHRCFRSLARAGHNAGMPAHDFKLALTRVIEPTRGPGAELATLEGCSALRRSNETMAPSATALGFRSRVAAEGCGDKTRG
jgi:hypothetical protein